MNGKQHGIKRKCKQTQTNANSEHPLGPSKCQQLHNKKTKCEMELCIHVSFGVFIAVSLFILYKFNTVCRFVCRHRRLRLCVAATFVVVVIISSVQRSVSQLNSMIYTICIFVNCIRYAMQTLTLNTLKSGITHTKRNCITKYTSKHTRAHT